MMHHAVCASPPQPDEDYATPKRMMRSNSVRESPRKDDALRRHPRARSEYDGDDEPDTDPLDFVCRQSSMSMDDGDLSECESGCYCGGYGASQCTFTSGVITPERKGLKLPHLGALNSSAVGDELHCAPLPLLERENGNLFSLTGTSSAGSRFLRRDNGSRRVFDRSPNRDDPRRRPGDTSKGGLSSNTDFSAQLSVSIDFDRCSRAGMIPAAEECEGSEVDALAITATPITLNGITEKAPAVCRVQLRALSRVSPRYVPFSPNNDAKIDAPASATPREEVDGVCYVVPRNLSSFRRRSGGHEDGTMLNEVQGYHSLVRDVDTGRYPGMRVQGAGLRFKPANPVERTTGEEDDSALHSLTGNSAIIGIWQRSLRSSPSHPDFLSTSGSLMETRKRSGRIQRSFAPPMTPLTARPSIPPPLHPPRKLAAAPTLNANNKTSAPVSVVSYVASGPSPLLALTPSLSMSRRSSMKYGSTTAVSVMDNYHFNSSMASPIGQAGSSSLKSPLLLSRLATRRNQAPIAPVMSSTERVSFVHLAD